MGNKEFVSPELEKDTIEELSRQLIETNAELKKLQKEREIMYANISHDLRAPMTAIRSGIDLAKSDKDMTASDLRKILEIIDRRAKTLESLINDMYLLYTLTEDKKAAKTETIEAAPFLEEFFYDLILDEKYDGYKLELDIEQGLNCMIHVEVQKLVRVLDNLFTNAVRYAGAGSKIQLKAGIEGNKLRISVVDNGPGIPEKDLPYIFMRTYTVSESRTPENGKTSSGLGLAIAKAIIEKNNGTIECRSILGEETDFRILLPIYE